MSRFEYRPDIDGLRAIAVLLVLLFHAHLGFAGGYIGVDVFFVISGFLITGLILKQQQAETFSLSSFWGRRICRIIPAASVMVAVTLVVGCVVLLPGDLTKLARSAVAQQLMLSNVHFYQDSSYFGGQAESKALLHTWSLAVEEQFYLVFPFLLLLCKRLRKRTTLSVMLGLALVSLGLSQWSAYYWEMGGFFLLPTRMWELLLGAMLAFCPEPSRWKTVWREASAWGGLACILASGVIYSSNTRFPGVAALVPCIGTALIIYANAAGRTSLGRILSNKGLVFVGLLSYSLYLWHWPIFAFLHYNHGHDLSLTLRIGALALSSLCAYFSWRFVETPFRRGFSQVALRKTASAAVASAIVLLGVCFLIGYTGGLPSRYPERVQRFLSAKRNLKDYRRLEQVREGSLPNLGRAREAGEPIDFIVWGDSHGMALRELIDSLGKQHDLSGVMASQMGTPPLLDVWKPRQWPFAEMTGWNDAVLDYIRDKRIRNVILVSRWAQYVDGSLHGKKHMMVANKGSSQIDRDHARAAYRSGLTRTLDELESLGAMVVIVKQVPKQIHNPQRQVAFAALLGQATPNGVSIEAHLERQKNANSIIDAVAKGRSGVLVCDPTEACFNGSGFCKIANGDGIFYKDGNHLTPLGADCLLRSSLEPAFGNEIRIGSRKMAAPGIRR